MKKIKVAVNGYGVIGKRVADAVRQQDNMELIGVADVGTDYRIKTAIVLGIDVYASVSEKVSDMRHAGIPVKGTLRSCCRRSMSWQTVRRKGSAPPTSRFMKRSASR